MKTPPEIIDLLQPIISIFFYQIPYKHRAVLILSDNVAEISCKLKIKEKNPSENLRKIDFPELLKRVKVPKRIYDELIKFHELRNEFQHRSPIYTVEEKTSADSVFTTIELIKFLWKKNALKDIPEWICGGLRIIHLCSSNGNMERRNTLESKVINEIDLYLDVKTINTNILIKEDGKLVKGDLTGSVIEKRLPRKNEAIIQVCLPKYWTYLLQNHTSTIVQFLDDLKVEEV